GEKRGNVLEPFESECIGPRRTRTDPHGEGRVDRPSAGFCGEPTDPVQSLQTRGGAEEALSGRAVQRESFDPSDRVSVCIEPGEVCRLHRGRRRMVGTAGPNAVDGPT